MLFILEATTLPLTMGRKTKTFLALVPKWFVLTVTQAARSKESVRPEATALELGEVSVR